MEAPQSIIKGFLMDEMLAKLGRFLRIAGYHVEMPRGLTDRKLAKMSNSGNLVLLTRDRDLSNMKGVLSLRIISDDIKHQLDELVSSGLLDRVSRGSSRCPVCGNILRIVRESDSDWATISNDLPEGVRSCQHEIYPCSGCGKLYWKGSHWEKLMAVLEPLGIIPRIEDGSLR